MHEKAEIQNLPFLRGIDHGHDLCIFALLSVCLFTRPIRAHLGAGWTKLKQNALARQ